MNGGGGQMEQAGEDDTLVTEDMLWLGAQGENPRDAYVMDLHNRGLTHITSLEQCTRLRSLDLSFNKLTSLAGLSSLRDLRELKLYGNSIQYISGLERLSCLTTLLLHDNLIEKIEGLDNLRSLKHLRLDGNRLTGVSRLSRLTSLTSLNLSRNGIKSLHPRAFEGLTLLEELDLSSNQLTSVESVGKCTKLQELQLSRNRLATLSTLPSIASLDIIYVEDNRLTSLQGLPVLPMLTELYASGNAITTLDGLAESCPSLEILDVRNNRLSDDTSLQALKSLSQLAELSIAGNPVNTTNKRMLSTTLPTLALVDDIAVADMHAQLEDTTPEMDEEAKGLEAFKARMGIRTDIRVINGHITTTPLTLTPADTTARPKTPMSRPAMPMSRPGTPGQGGSGGKTHTPMMHQRPLSARTGGGQKLLSTREFAHAAEHFKQQMQSYRSELDAVIAALREGLARDPQGGIPTGTTEWRLPDPPVMATISSHILALPPGKTGDDIAPAPAPAPALGRKTGADVAVPAEGMTMMSEAPVETSPRQRVTRGGKGGEVVRESVMNLRSSAIREALVLYAQVLGTKEAASEDIPATQEIETTTSHAPEPSRPTSSSASTRDSMDNTTTDHIQASTPTPTHREDIYVIPDTDVESMTSGLNTRMRPLDTDFTHDMSTLSTLPSTLSSSRTAESEQSDTTISGEKGGNASVVGRQAQQMRPRAVGYKSFRLPSARQEGPLAPNVVAVGAKQQHTRQ